MRGVIVIISVFWSVFAFGQEVKLGLPVGHSDDVNSAIFSPDGDLVLTASDDNTIRLWDKRSGIHLWNFLGKHSFGFIRFNPKGANIIAASKYGDIYLLDSETGDLISELKANKISSIDYSPDGSQLLILSGFGKAQILDIESWKFIKEFKFDGEDLEVRSAEYSKDGLKILTVMNVNTVKIWDIETIDPVLTLGTSSDGFGYGMNSDSLFIYSAHFSPDASQVIAKTHDNYLCAWNIKTGKRVFLLNGYENKIENIFYCPDGKNVLIETEKGKVEVWELKKNKLLYEYDNFHLGDISSAIFSPVGTKIITQTSEKIALLWEIESGKILYKYNGSSYVGINSIQFSPDGANILIASQEVSLLDIKNKRLIKSFKDRSSSFSSLVFNKDSTDILSLNQGKKIEFNTKTGGFKYIPKSPSDIKLRCISLDSLKQFYSKGYDFFVKNLDDESTVQLSGNFGDFDNPLFSEDGSKILFYDKHAFKGQVSVWDAEKGILLNSFNTPVNPRVTFSPDASKILVLSRANNDTINLWDVKKACIYSQFIHNSTESEKDFGISGFRIFQFSSDGSELFLRHFGGTMYLLEVSEKNLNVIEKTANESFSIESNWLNHLGGPLYVDTSERYVLIDGVLNLLNSKGEITQILKPSTSLVKSYLKSDKHRKMFTLLYDNSFVVFNLNTGEQIIHQYNFENNPSKWVHIHPSGLFDASTEAMELMCWIKGLEIIEFSQLKDRYWVPGLWQKVMKGEQLPSVRGMQELKLQPKVEFGELKNEQLPIKLSKRDGGYGKVSIFINGKEVINDARGNDLDTSQAEQTILYSIKDHPYLVNGENRIEVKSSSADGFVQGRGDLFETYIEKSISEPQFFGVVVGVSEYMNSSIDLKYPVNDAKAISTSLQLGAENLFGEEKTFIYSITSEERDKPTKQNIENVFETISQKAKPEDVIVIYLSGHGVTWGGEQGDFYFLTSDATAANKNAYSDPVIRENNTISTSEWVEMLKSVAALKQVMIIDACGSGKAVDNLIASRDGEASQIKAIDRMKDRTGMYIISGCTADAVSYEASQYGQGLLTYSILEAMKGAAIKSDGSVDVDLMMQHARERVPVLADGVGGIQQPQLLAPKGGSFDIGILNEADKKAIPLASPKRVFVRSAFMSTEEMEDDLNLSDILDEQLISISSKGTESKIVYFDAKKYPNACKISGGYTVEDEVIKLSLKIRCGEELEKVELKANSKEEIVKEILKLIE